MSVIDRESALNRIRKLVNHAKGPGERVSEAEVETYMRAARKLMQEWDVDEKDAFTAPAQQQNLYESIKQEEAYSRAGKLDKWMVELAWGPIELCDCKFYLGQRRDEDKPVEVKESSSWGKRGFKRKVRVTGYRQTITVYGLPRDVAVACELYKELMVTVRTMCKMEYGEARPKEYPIYCQAFATAVHYRVQKIKEDEKKTKGVAASTSTAIVIVKDALLKRYAEEQLHLTKAKSRSSGREMTDAESEAYDRGLAAGNKVSLETKVVRDNEKRTAHLP